MEKNPRHLEQNSKSNGPVFDKNETDISMLLEIWDTSKDSTEPSVVGVEETEKALSAIHKRIEESNTTNTPSYNKATATPLWKYLAAALVILSVGYFWMISPEKISIPFGETATIQLPDGSRVSLNSGSTLIRNKLFGITNRDISLNGEAFFNVEKDDTPFIVNANNAVVRVTGTSFNVRSWNDEPEIPAEVSVESGQVMFYSEENPDASVILNPGEKSSLPTGALIPENPQSFNSDQVFAWRNQNLSFNNQTLKTIFRQIERTFDTKITVKSEEISSSYLTTFYSRPDNLEALLNDICTVKGLSFTRTANGYMIQAK